MINRMNTKILPSGFFLEIVISSLALLGFSILSHAQSAKVSNMKITYDIQQSGIYGIKFGFSLDVHSMKDKSITVCAYFYDKSGTSHTRNYGGQSGYRTVTNHTSTWDTVTSPYESSHWEQFVLFLPYYALVHDSGKQEYSVCIEVRDQQTSTTIGQSSYYDFWLDWKDSNRNRTSTGWPVITHTTQNGMEVTRKEYADHVESEVQARCPSLCKNGACFYCQGAGAVSFGYGAYPCTACQGTGRCLTCKGQGFLTTTQTFTKDQRASNPYTPSSPRPSYSGSSSYAGSSAGGYVGGYSGGYGGSTTTGSSSSSTSSRRPCPYCGGSGKGTPKIVYSPNYTGKDNSVYCSTCGYTQAAHTHITPTCTVCNGTGYVGGY